jgi:ACS family tartrate transporter-like MFS transporter
MTDKDQVFAKCAWRLIPFIVLLYVINYLDRVNVGFAALTMNRDLGITPIAYGYSGSLLFVGYMLFQIPAVLFLERFGARRTVFWILLTWGAISASNALVQGETSLFLVRFLLGVAEAGFFPGMVFYLTLWFPATYRARVNAYFYSAIPLAFVIGGPLSGLILQMDGLGGLRGWQWLFVIEGLPACLLAFAALKLLPDGPRDATWLTAEEKAYIAQRVSADDKAQQRNLWPALRDPRVVALGMAYAGWQFGFYGLGLWLPQIVQAMGFSNLSNGFIVALPFLAAIVAMQIWSRSSDARGERIWHVALAALVSAGGFAAASVATASGSNVGAVIALTVAASGLISYMPPFLSLPPTFLGGTAAAGGIGLVSSLGRIGAMLGPAVVGYLRETTGDYSAAIGAMAVGQILAAVIVLGMGRTIRHAKRALGPEAR